MRRDEGFTARQPTAVNHAFAVLEAVAALGPGVTAGRLVEALPMSRATVYRILKHLLAHEYLVRDPDLTGFLLGERVRRLAAFDDVAPSSQRALSDQAHNVPPAPRGRPIPSVALTVSLPAPVDAHGPERVAATCGCGA